MNTKKIIALFSVILALFVALSLSVFAEDEPEVEGDDTMTIFAADTGTDTDTLDGAEPPLLGAENDADTGSADDTKGEGDTAGEPILTVGAEGDTDAVTDDGEVPAVGAEDDTAADSVDEDAAKDAADSVLDAVGTDTNGSTDSAEAVVTEPETGTWSNLGTSGIIGIVVAVVLCIAIIVVIAVLVPKKGGQKK